jgi:hypothetical protein
VRPPVRSYDLCLCDHQMAGIINTHYGTALKDGESFLEILRENIRTCSDCVELVTGDITQQSIDEPIEVLFLDVCKTPAVNSHIIKKFFSRLIPGRSVVIQQDFVHEWLPWLPITMGLFEPYFQFLGVIGESPSAVWLNTRAIPDLAPWEKEGAGDLYWDVPLPRLLGLFDRGIRSLTNENHRYWVELAKCRLIADRGQKTRALDLLDRLTLRFDRLPERPEYIPPPHGMKKYVVSSECLHS